VSKVPREIGITDQESLEPKKTRRGWNRKRPGGSGTEKDQESLEPKKQSRRVWNGKADQESLEPKKKNRKVWNRKKQTRRVWNRKRGD
jgi:hypothetical protein